MPLTPTRSRSSHFLHPSTAPTTIPVSQDKNGIKKKQLISEDSDTHSAVVVLETADLAMSAAFTAPV